MIRTLTRVGAVALLALTAVIAQAAPAQKPPEDGPRGLTATLVATKDTYTLDPAISGPDFAASLKKNNPGKAPATPKVDLILRINNPTDKPISIVIGGDQSTITLDLKGPGAVTIEPMVAMTMDYRSGMPVTIAAGKSADIAINSLSAGQRGITQLSYWTSEGDYTIAATFVCHADDGTGTKVTSDAAKLKITK